jgi:hypothetical protein
MTSSRLAVTPNLVMIRLSVAHLNSIRTTSRPHLIAPRASSLEAKHRRHAATEASRTTRLVGAIARVTRVAVVDSGVRLVLSTGAVIASVATRALTAGQGSNEVLATARVCRATNKVIVTVAQAAAHESEAAHAVGEVFRVPAAASGSRLIDFGRQDVVSNDDHVLNEEGLGTYSVGTRGQHDHAADDGASRRSAWTPCYASPAQRMQSGHGACTSPAGHGRGQPGCSRRAAGERTGSGHGGRSPAGRGTCELAVSGAW